MATIQSTFGHPPICVPVNTTVSEAARTMAKYRVGALVVTGGAGQVVGLLDERDVILRVVVPCRDACATRVAEVLSPDVPRVTPREDAARCSELMHTHKTRYLLVYDGDRLAGLVSMRDVIRALLGAREAEVRELTNYVGGSLG